MKDKEAKKVRLVEAALFHHVSISLLSVSFELPKGAIEGILKKAGVVKEANDASNN